MNENLYITQLNKFRDTLEEIAGKNPGYTMDANDSRCHCSDCKEIINIARKAMGYASIAPTSTDL